MPKEKSTQVISTTHLERLLKPVGESVTGDIFRVPVAVAVAVAAPAVAFSLTSDVAHAAMGDRGSISGISWRLSQDRLALAASHYGGCIAGGLIRSP